MRPRDLGVSLVDLLVALGLATTIVAMGAPVAGEGRDAMRLRQGCQWLSGVFRLARQHAVRSGRRTAVVFEPGPAPIGWRLHRCHDGNDDGVRAEDVASGTDPCETPAWPAGAWVEGLSIDRASAVPDPSSAQTHHPVAFGTTQMAVFAPTGTATSGTVVLRTRRDRHCAVRVAGVTGRVRVLLFDARTRQWITP